MGGVTKVRRRGSWNYAPIGAVHFYRSPEGLDGCINDLGRQGRPADDDRPLRAWVLRGGLKKTFKREDLDEAKRWVEEQLAVPENEVSWPWDREANQGEEG